MPYFDHNATTPLAPIAKEAWLRASEAHWQNPSSPYRDAARAKLRLDSAREHLAQMLGCAPETIVFTSGATEAVNAVLAYWGRVLLRHQRIALSPTEHSCVVEAAKAVFGDRILFLECDRNGVVDSSALHRLLHANNASDLGGVMVMAANNETGVIQSWMEIAHACAARGVAYFCDAAQWLGKLPASGLGHVGWVVGSAHKFGGPKGVGFLKVALGSDDFRIQRGGAQERGHRAGTENLPGVAAMVAALAEVEQRKVFQETSRVQWRTRSEHAILAAVPGARIVAADADRLWNTISLLMPHSEHHRWVARLDKLNLQVSIGSACSTGKAGPSHVLAALGYAPDEAKRVVRISSGWETTEEDWNVLVAALVKVESELRAETSAVVNL